jgi:predicted transcriptional regulator
VQVPGAAVRNVIQHNSTEDGFRMFTVTPRPRSGIFGESTNDEAYRVLPGEDRLVKEIMTQDVATTTAKEAIEVIRNRRVPILIVCVGNEPAIAITEYDLAITVSTDDRGDSVTLCDLIKHRMIIRCREDVILADAIPAMLDHRARHLPVVDERGDLVGALSLVDALGAITPDAAALWQAKIRRLWSEAPELT